MLELGEAVRHAPVFDQRVAVKAADVHDRDLEPPAAGWSDDISEMRSGTGEARPDAIAGRGQIVDRDLKVRRQRT